MMRRGADAGIARGFLVLADSEEMAAEDRAMQHDPHERRDEEEGDEGMRHAVAAPDRQPFSAGKDWPKPKPAVPSLV